MNPRSELELELELELLDLLDQLEGDSHSVETRLKLRDLLLASSELRAAFIQHAHLVGGLRWLVQPVNVDAAGNICSQASQRLAQAPRALPIRLSTYLLNIRWPVALATLLVAIVSYGTFAFIAWNLRPNKLLTFSESDNTSVAIVCDAAHVAWSPGASVKPKDSSIRVGETLEIESGTMEFKLKTGTKLVVEGPADWSVSGENSVSLRSGKLLARVPEEAIGFTVETPAAKIVDLGTEFAVEADEHGATEVQVLKGKVDVSYPTSAKEDGSRQTVRMTAGTARQFTSRGDSTATTFAPIAPWVDRTAVGKSSVDKRKELSTKTKYTAAVLAEHPLGYWQFSDKGDRIAADASGHGNVGEYLGFVSINNPGICSFSGDHSLRFLGASYAGYVQINDFELPASFTIELWARSATPGWKGFGWLFSCRQPHGVVLYPSAPGRHWQLALNNVRGEARPLGPHVPPNIADRFHHYVGSYDAVTDRGCMYFDGVLVGETNDLMGDDRRREPTRLTFYVGRDDNNSPDGYGEGWIDEVAIYEGALSPETIRRHFEVAEVSSPPGSSPTSINAE